MIISKEIYVFGKKLNIKHLLIDRILEIRCRYLDTDPSGTLSQVESVAD